MKIYYDDKTDLLYLRMDEREQQVEKQKAHRRDRAGRRRGGQNRRHRDPGRLQTRQPSRNPAYAL